MNVTLSLISIFSPLLVLDYDFVIYINFIHVAASDDVKIRLHIE